MCLCSRDFWASEAILRKFVDIRMESPGVMAQWSFPGLCAKESLGKEKEKERGGNKCRGERALLMFLDDGQQQLASSAIIHSPRLSLAYPSSAPLFALREVLARTLHPPSSTLNRSSSSMAATTTMVTTANRRTTRCVWKEGGRGRRGGREGG